MTTRNGVSAIELLIASALVAVCLLAIATMFPTAATNVDYNAAIARATALGQQRIEQMKNLPFTTLVGMDTASIPPALPASGQQTLTEGNNTFTRREWVRVSGTAPRREAVLSVILEWAEPTGAKTLRLDALRVENN